MYAAVVSEASDQPTLKHPQEGNYMLAVSIAAYLAGASRRNAERISAREKVDETPPARRLPSAGPVPLTAGGAQFAAEAGWVLQTVELLETDRYSGSDPAADFAVVPFVRFRFLFSFAHPVSGRIWDTTGNDVIVYRRNPKGDQTPTEEDAEKALNQGWAQLYMHLRREEKDVR